MRLHAYGLSFRLLKGELVVEVYMTFNDVHRPRLDTARSIASKSSKRAIQSDLEERVRLAEVAYKLPLSSSAA